MDNTTKIYSMTPPGFMTERKDSMRDERPEEKEHLPIGMAYVPRQVWRDIYENGKGLMRGTIFEELDLPFKGDAKR